MSIWRRIFGGIGRGRSASDQESDPGPGPDERLDQLLGELRQKLEKFLIVRSAPHGELPTGGPFTLTKTNDSLFRLDASLPGASGGSLSILINTRPFLTRQKTADGNLKVQGLLRMSEIGLSRALQEKSVGSFLGRAEPPAEASLPLFRALVGTPTGASPGSRGAPAYVPEVLPQPSDLLNWAIFDADQMIARNSPNILAHVLVHATPELESFLRKRFSRRLRLLLIDELERLVFPASRPEMNPGSRNRGLLQYEQALTEFRQSMADYLMHLERGRLRAERGSLRTERESPPR